MKTQTTLKTILIFAFILVLNNNSITGQNVGIGSATFTPDPSAVLELKSNEQGFLPPRMTTSERDLISNPAEGLVIFNTTSKCLNYRVGNNWFEVCGNCTPMPLTPTAGTHIPSETQIVWNWESVAGADYKYNTVNNYTTAIDNGTNTTYTQTVLDCETEYTLYVWAHNVCGNSSVLILTQSTSACPFACGTSVNFTYKGSQVTYGTVLSANNKCWLDRNLGATAVATSSTHTGSYGDFFQWGRRDDGHQTRTSGTTTTLSNTDNPAHGSFIITSNSPWDWRNPQNPNLWQGFDGTNNPCPAGWRIPTEVEWNTECLSWTSNDLTGAINSPLRLPLAGQRSWSGSIFHEGSYGCYWSSNVDSTRSKHLEFRTGFYGTYMESSNRARGVSVRCIKD